MSVIGRGEKAACAAAAIAAAAGTLTGNDRLTKATKPFIAPSLAAGVIRNPHPSHSGDRALLVAGLVAATGGDVVLLDPDAGDNLAWGAAFFAVMQATYVTILARHGARPTTRTALRQVVAWLAATGLVGARERRLVVPLGAYGLLIGAMAALADSPTSFSDPLRPATDPSRWLSFGGALFTISDGLILLRRYLVTGERRRRITEAAVLCTYAGAQYLLVEGLARLSETRPA